MESSIIYSDHFQTLVKIPEVVAPRLVKSFKSVIIRQSWFKRSEAVFSYSRKKSSVSIFENVDRKRKQWVTKAYEQMNKLVQFYGTVLIIQSENLSRISKKWNNRTTLACKCINLRLDQASYIFELFKYKIDLNNRSWFSKAIKQQTGMI